MTARFGAEDIAYVATILRQSGEYSAEELYGVDKFIDLLRTVEEMSEPKIKDAVRKYVFRSFHVN